MSATYNYESSRTLGLGPQGRPMGGVAPGVAADSQGRSLWGRRHPPAPAGLRPRTGPISTTWGADLLGNPHHLWVDGEDQVYAADTDDHTSAVSNRRVKWSTLGARRACRARLTSPLTSPPKPCAALLGICTWPMGTANTASIRISDSGELVHSWGSAGTGPGQFALPHSLWVDRDERVWAVDRENNASSALTPRAATWTSGPTWKCPWISSSPRTIQCT